MEGLYIAANYKWTTLRNIESPRFKAGECHTFLTKWYFELARFFFYLEIFW